MTAVPICHLRFSDVVGGVETHILSLLPALDPARYRARVICFPNPPFEERLRARGIEFDVIARRGKGDLGFPLRLRRLIRAGGYRLLHTHHEFSNIYTVLACRLWPGRPKHVTTRHSFAESDHSASMRRARMFNWLDRWLVCPRVDRVIAVSQNRRREILARRGLAPERVSLVLNGIARGAERDPKEIEGQLRRALGVAKGTPLVGFVGRLNREKGPDVFVEMFARVAERNPDAMGVVVGDGRERETLVQQARQLGLGDRLRFHPFTEPVAPILVDLDAVVMTSRTEGFPMLLLEAMALARPVVVSSVGGMPEVVKDGENGWLCPSEDASAFADRVIGVLSDRPRANRIGEAARSLVLKEFTADHMAERMMSLYDDVLGIGR